MAVSECRILLIDGGWGKRYFSESLIKSSIQANVATLIQIYVHICEGWFLDDSKEVFRPLVEKCVYRLSVLHILNWKLMTLSCSMFMWCFFDIFNDSIEYILERRILYHVYVQLQEWHEPRACGRSFFILRVPNSSVEDLNQYDAVLELLVIATREGKNC